MLSLALTDETQRVLALHELSPDRLVDVSDAIGYLTGRDIVISPAAVEFMRHFEGIRLRWFDTGYAPFLFDARVALDSISNEEMPAFKVFYGEPLCPVGSGPNGIGCVAPSGRMIFLHDQWEVYIVVADISAGINLICDRGFREWEQVFIPAELKPYMYRHF